MRHANYTVEDVVVIRDVGPWGEHPTVTSDVEHVVDELRENLEEFGGAHCRTCAE